MMQDWLNTFRSPVVTITANLPDFSDPSKKQFYIYGVTMGCSVFVSLYLFVNRAKPNETIPLVTGGYQSYFFGHYFWLKDLLNHVYKDYEEAFDLIYPLNSKIIQFSSAFTSNHIYILDPSLLKTVFHSEQNKYLEPQHNVSNKHIYGELLGNGVLTYKHINNTRYTLQIQMIKQKISNNRVQQYMFECANYHSKRLVMKLEELRNDGNRIDINGLTECFLYDLFMNIYTGDYFRCINMFPKQLTFQNTFKSVMERMKKRNGTTFWKLKRFFDFGDEKIIKEQLKIINKSVTSLIAVKQMKIESAQGTNSSPTDLLSALLSDESIEVLGLRDVDIRDIIINMLFATIESTKLLILWTLYELSQNPSISKQVHGEVNVFLQRETDINMENIHDDNEYFTLLDCCLFETLRLHPPVCKRVYNVKKDISFKCDDVKLKLNKNEQIIIHGYVYGRLHSIWGEDALKFNPQRFRNKSMMSNGSLEYIPFGVESDRTCLGKYIALMVAKVMIVEILKKYDYQSVNIEETTYFMDDDMLRIKNPFLIKIYPRDFV